MAKHALLSASGAHRWLLCPPSVRLEQDFPDKPSAYAEEGTLAHEFAELAVSKALGLYPSNIIDDKRISLAASEAGKRYRTMEMYESVDRYADEIKKLMAELTKNKRAPSIALETKVNFSKWVPGGFGTSDCIIAADDILYIIDFKYGKGHKVDAYKNPQLMLYALGALESYSMIYDIRTVRMRICQPRISSESSEYEMSVTDLYNWANTYVKKQAALAIKGEGEFHPSEETCKFCKAKAECRARYEQNLKAFDVMHDPDLISLEEAGKAFERASEIKAWLADIEDLLKSALFKGAKVDGWKLVEGRSNRKFKDEKAVIKALKKAGFKESQIIEKKLIPLTRMEKDLGKTLVTDILGDLIEKPSGKPTLVQESDKRPALNIEAALLNAFDEETN